MIPDDFQAHLAEEELAPLRLKLGLLALSVVVLDVGPHSHPVEIHAKLPQYCIFHEPDIVFLVLELLLHFLTCDLADLGCNSIDMIGFIVGFRGKFRDIFMENFSIKELQVKACLKTPNIIRDRVGNVPEISIKLPT